jgi:hypothetical protein
MNSQELEIAVQLEMKRGTKVRMEHNKQKMSAALLYVVSNTVLVVAKLVIGLVEYAIIGLGATHGDLKDDMIVMG